MKSYTKDSSFFIEMKTSYDTIMKLFKYCASGELRQYTYEVAMQKLNEEFELKRDKKMTEFCKEILEKYENGTLEDYLEQ